MFLRIKLINKMKKFLVKGALLLTAFVFSAQADAQISFGDILKNVVSGTKDNTETTNQKSNTGDSTQGGLLSALTSIFSSDKVATEDKIIGTWVYEEPAVVLTGDNALKNIGGKLAASAVEGKLSEKLESFGIKKGCVTMTFSKDGNFTQTLMGKTLSGTYSIDDKNIVLKYGGRVSQIIGTTQLDGNNLLIVMDASKLLKYVNVLGDISQNTTLQTATSLLGSMDGLECGLKLVKQ
jgi:hypothetical protein